MSQENRISAAISEADKQTVLQQLASIRQLLGPALQLSLTPEERLGLAKMGDKSLAFVGKALEYAAANPTLVPGYLDIPEALKDYTLAVDLKQLLRELGTLTQTMEDNMMIAGAEAYDASLIFHGSIRGASRANTPGSKAIYEDLVARFPHGGRKADKPATT